MISLQAQSTSGEKILLNGNIYTLNPQRPVAEAVAIRGDRIVAVGDLSSVRRNVGKHASMIDLHGKYLLPGLVDSHNHAIKGGVRLLTADADDELLSFDELANFAHEAVQTGKGVRGGGLYITGIHSAQWTNVIILDSLFNNAPYTKKPVLLLGTDGHTAWSNAALLRLAGITNEFVHSLPNDQRTYYGQRDESQLNGLLSEQAIQKARRALPPSPVTPYQGALSGVRHLNSLGITAWLDPAAGHIDDGLQNEALTAYAQLANDELLTAHVATTVVADANGSTTPQFKMLNELQRKYNGKHVDVLGLKIFADGVLEYPTQTAALSLPYSNSGSFGSLMVDPGHLNAFVSAADRDGILIHIHAIGDRAVSASLDAIGAARNQNKNSNLPHSITHLQLVAPGDYNRFAELNVLPCMQLLWATADRYTIELVKPYIDAALFMGQYPAKSLLKAGATLCGASDWPVSSANPFAAISIAESRKGGMGVLNARETVSRIEMIKAYTINAAKLLLMDKKIGSIEPGKQADFVLVDRDVLAVDENLIKHTQIIWTMFGGKIVFNAKDE
ncbi:MAG: amidohydrolase [Cyclobacteriaceae bacterium]|nr:amidohydrolase [Cyclobacteriaceae bacterium]MDH4295739.1 amidohydrolase [Cyclobacteriaceae bacterium]MDH5249565.1 amidohydrolase [Cyclobacteriaceae bacterium]